MKVTVIIPAYNVEQYIEECLNCLANQTLQDMQIICVNDGSNDRTLEVINRFAQKDKRVVVVDKENGGPSSARNAGMQEIGDSEYILFLDSDDYLHEKALSILYKKAVEQELDVLYYSAKPFCESDNERLQIIYQNYEKYYARKADYPEVYNGKKLYSMFMENNDYKASPCLQLIKREFLERNQIYFYDGIIHEDEYFTFNVLEKAERAGCIKDQLYFRRVREGSIMTKEKGVQNVLGYLAVIDELVNIASKLSNDEKRYADAIAIHINKLSKQIGKMLNHIPEEAVIREIDNMSMEKRVLYRTLLESQKKYLGTIEQKNDKIRKQKEKIEKQSKKGAFENGRSRKIASMLIKMLIVATIFFPYRDQYIKRSPYYTTFSLPVFISIILMSYLSIAVGTKKVKGKFIYIYSALLGCYLIVFTAMNFFFHHYYSDMIHKVSAFMLLLFFLLKMPEDFFDEKKIVEFLIGTVVLSCVIGIVYYYAGYDQIKFVKGSLVPKFIDLYNTTYAYTKEHRLTFTYPHKSEHGLFLILYLAICLKYHEKFKSKILFWGTLVLLGWTIILTDSIATIGFTLFVLLGFLLNKVTWKKFLRKNKKVFFLVGAILVPATILVVLFLVNTKGLNSLNYRIEIWNASIHMILENPKGIGMDFEKVNIYGQVNTCHNLFLIDMLRYSIPVGLLLFLLMFLLMTKSIKSDLFFGLGTWMAILGLMSIDYSLKGYNFPLFILCIYILFFKDSRNNQYASCSSA